MEEGVAKCLVGGEALLWIILQQAEQKGHEGYVLALQDADQVVSSLRLHAPFELIAALPKL